MKFTVNQLVGIWLRNLITAKDTSCLNRHLVASVATSKARVPVISCKRHWLLLTFCMLLTWCHSIDNKMQNMIGTRWFYLCSLVINSSIELVHFKRCMSMSSGNNNIWQHASIMMIITNLPWKILTHNNKTMICIIHICPNMVSVLICT